MRSLRLRDAVAGALAAIWVATAHLLHAQDRVSAIDDVVSLYARFGLSGTVLVSGRDGKVLYEKALGLADRERKIPVESDTRFSIASMSKPFVAALVLQLVEQGKLRLDGTVGEYVPDYPSAAGRRITIHQLLTFTSGLPDYVSILAARGPTWFQATYPPDTIVHAVAERELMFEPGSQFGPSNSDYVLLALILQRVTGKAYARLLRERILDPIGMDDSGATGRPLSCPSCSGPIDRTVTDTSGRWAVGYERAPAGLQRAPRADISLALGAGDIYSTARDQYLWDRALRTDRLLSRASRELMFRAHAQTRPPLFELDGFGYGWAVGTLTLAPGAAPLRVAQGVGGGIPGYTAKLTRVLDGEGPAVIILGNEFQTSLVLSLDRELLRALYGAPLSIAIAVGRTALDQGIAAATARYRALKRESSAAYDFGEPELNRLGYWLLRAGRGADAVEIFKLNVEAYPKGYNTYDSLGEAYMVTGQRELAVANYRRSLELNPQNENARRMLARLGATP